MTNAANPEPQPDREKVVRNLGVPETDEDNAAEDTRSPKFTERGDRAFILDEPIVPEVEAEPPEVVRDLVVPDEGAESEEDDDRSPKKTDRG
ncbi:hypothetical protein [Leptolyngbya ohadii]|uniref:hypothetical protein n=1 Tax=Leptolyngbya ohadii TaxID=1962290 RepID=UPI000B59C2F8|nr:hypothetical protein [Leptolyngbya ohadii]